MCEARTGPFHLQAKARCTFTSEVANNCLERWWPILKCLSAAIQPCCLDVADISVFQQVDHLLHVASYDSISALLQLYVTVRMRGVCALSTAKSTPHSINDHIAIPSTTAKT